MASNCTEITLPSSVHPVKGEKWEYPDTKMLMWRSIMQIHFKKFPFFLLRGLFPFLPFQHNCKGKGRVNEFGRCSSISSSLGCTPSCACKACCTSTNKTASHFFDKSCTGVLGSVNGQLIYCLENYSLLIYITRRQPQIYTGLNQRENAKVSVILI